MGRGVYWSFLVGKVTCVCGFDLFQVMEALLDGIQGKESLRCIALSVTSYIHSI